MAKDNKTSKTARVMNLLSKKTDPVPPAAGEGSPAPAAPAAPAAPVPPIVTSMAPDAAVSVQIRNALEDALEGELAAQQPPAPQPEPVPEPEPVPTPPQPEPVQPEPAPQPQPAPVQPEPAPQPQPAPVQQQPAPQAVPPEPQPAPAPQPEPQPAPAPAAEPVPQPAPEEPHFHVPLVPDSPGYINVMQLLVEEKAPKYIKMFGLCHCERCLADVKAYTLNHLPAKYVVIEKGDLIPRLTIYEGRFSSDVTAQLLQACKVVMERPHHDR